MAQQSVVELQRTAILRMLSLQGTEEQALVGTNQTWKVLVYDKFCQEVVAPLLKVGGLMKHGVTLHLSLHTERLPVPDVPAVYFVEPTEENIKRIGADLAKGLYESCYINFASSVNRSCLQELARGAMQANATNKVQAVFDRYVSFVSLGANLFSLNLPAAYETIHSPLADEIIQQYIERIVDGVLSVLITTRTLPVIRCPPGEAAEMVGRRLDERIRELMKTAAGAELFSGDRGSAGATRAAADANSAGRPLLCILDRDVDLVTMLNHTWTYQAMAHDVLGMRLNRLNVPVDESGAGVKPKEKCYDVSENDAFWLQHAAEPFPDVATAVGECIDEYNKKRAELGKSGEGADPAESLGPGLAQAINMLPEMTDKKRSIDMHTNIATALLNEVKARELDNYYEMEDKFATQSLNTSISQLQEIINDKQRGTLADKTRALMVLYLTKPSITSAQLQPLVEALNAAGGDTNGVTYLEHLTNIRNMMAPTLNAAGGSAQKGTLGGAFNLAGLADRGASMLAGINNIRNIVASKKELPICTILDALMEQKASPSTDNYLYLDPKLPAAGYGQEQPRIRAPFRRAVAFVIGGGNYAEMQSLQEWAQGHGRQVSYGATDLVSPVNFLDELSHLGQAQSGGGGTDLS